MMSAIAYNSASMLSVLLPVFIRDLQSVTVEDLMIDDVRNTVLKNAGVVLILMAVFSISTILSALRIG